MSQQLLLPSWVIEQSLNWRLFDCCGDADLFPFKCHACNLPLVLCYECDSLYVDLHDLSARRYPTLDRKSWSCPRCSNEFDNNYMRSPRHRIAFDEWNDAGLTSLLIDRPFAELVEMLTGSAAQLADFLRRGMRSTARTRICEYRNLAEAVAFHFPAASEYRERAENIARSSTLSNAMDWYSTIAGPNDRAYALLGTSDVLFPESTPFTRTYQVGQLDPQSLVVQSVGVLIGSPSLIAGKLP